MKMKKVLVCLLAVILAVGCLACFTACDDEEENQIKIGMLCLHDKNSTYDKNFIDAMETVQKELGLKNSQVVIMTGVPEGDDCYQKACQLAEDGCDIIFADSFGHEQYLIKAAKKYPNVLFAHATGTMAHTENLPNFVNAFAAIYEGRYLAGIVAGMKMNEMIAAGQFTEAEAKMGYVGAYTYAEVMSGYTSFYLGAKSVCPSVTMEVTFTGSWYDETAENNAAKTLISRGCKLISQHADSMGAPNACEEAGVPNVSYNGSTKAACPNTFLVSSKINWAPYYRYLIENVSAGKMSEIQKDWTGTIVSDSVQITELGSAVADKTADALAKAKTALVAGTLKVFDTEKDNYITVGGKKLTSYMADVNTDADYTPDTEAVYDGYFHESVSRSAPYFNVEIDGITLLDRNYGN